MIQKEIFVKSTLDQTMQPSLFYESNSVDKRPLLVGLHTWSFDRFNQIDNMLPLAEKYDFNLLLPEFRGSNLVSNPNHILACGSEYAKQDIKDAIDYYDEQQMLRLQAEAIRRNVEKMAERSDKKRKKKAR